MKGLVSAVLSGVLLVTFAGAAGATQEPVSFTCTATAWLEGTEGTLWENGNTSHGRGLNPVWRNRGDALCAGTLNLVFNYDINWLTGQGTIWGTWRTDLKKFPGSGFEGTFTESLSFTGEVVGEGSTVGSGYGGLDGWRFKSTIVEIYLGYIVETGEAFLPGG